MRQLHLVAMRTLDEVRQLDGEVRATLTLAGMRDTSLGYTHGVVMLLFGSPSGLGDSGGPVVTTGEGWCRTDGGV